MRGSSLGWIRPNLPMRDGLGYKSKPTTQSSVPPLDLRLGLEKPSAAAASDLGVDLAEQGGRSVVYEPRRGSGCDGARLR